MLFVEMYSIWILHQLFFLGRQLWKEYLIFKVDVSQDVVVNGLHRKAYRYGSAYNGVLCILISVSADSLCFSLHYVALTEHYHFQGKVWNCICFFQWCKNLLCYLCLKHALSLRSIEKLNVVMKGVHGCTVNAPFWGLVHDKMFVPLCCKPFHSFGLENQIYANVQWIWDDIRFFWVFCM